MNISLLSGAYKNAGDFLIVDRTIKLLNYVYPDCCIKLYERNKTLDEELHEINKTDVLVFGGGPAYAPLIFPDYIPVCSSLSDITVPVYTIGLGWHGASSSNRLIYSDYKFSAKDKKYIGWLGRNSSLSCRDWYSVRVLRNNGFQNTVMTGCPAWYDIDRVKNTELRTDINIPFKKICFSDVGNPKNLNLSLILIKYFRNRFPNAKLVYVFHRGIQRDRYTNEESAKMYTDFAESLKEYGVDYLDISYSADGFKIYDDCDLHIGMRVHAHIYNLSKRNISILIEEDGRGTGVDDALGLFSIKSYDEDLRNFYRPKHRLSDKIVWRYIKKQYMGEYSNPYLINQVEDYLYMLESSNFLVLKQAFKRQREYFEYMIRHIESIAKG